MQKVILVVEHNANLRDTITHLLWKGGYLVLAAADGATAIDLGIPHCEGIGHME